MVVKHVKHIVLYLLLIVTILNTSLIYLYGGQTISNLIGNYSDSTLKIFLTVLSLLLVGIFVFIEDESKSRALKKNLLRISILMITILSIVSIYSRITEGYDIFIFWRWINTILYMMILITLLSISHHLYFRLRRIRLNNLNRIKF